MSLIRFAADPEKFITQAIVKFTRENPGNRQKSGRGKYWDKPLVGFAAGGEPLFKQYKKIIGSFHQAPPEFFAKALGLKKKSSPVAVISWILPASEAASFLLADENGYVTGQTLFVCGGTSVSGSGGS